MSIGFGRAIASALGGTLEGLAESAVREDEKRDELSKVILAQRIKNREKALELSQEQTQALQDENESVTSLMTVQVNGKPMSRAEATRVYRTARDLKVDPLKILEQYSIESEAGGKIVDVPSKKKTIADQTVAALAEEEGGLFAKGRAKDIDATANRLLRAAGYQEEIAVPQAPKVTGVTLKPKADPSKYKPTLVTAVNTATKEVVQDVVQVLGFDENNSPKIEYFTQGGQPFVPGENIVITDNPSAYTKKDEPTGFQIGSFTITDAESNEPRVVEGRLNPNTGIREILDDETGKYVAAPTSATWNGKTPTVTKEETDPRFSEVYSEVKKTVFEGKGSKAFSDLSGEYLSQRAGVRTLFENYEILAPLALDRRNYSVLNRTIGSFVTGAQNEFAGISSVFMFNADANGQPQPTEFDGLGVLSQLQASEEGLRGAQDAASKAKLMENLALQMAIADIIADGDPRPSDFDVRARMDSYRASSPESFLRTAKATIQRKLNALNGKLETIKETGTYKELVANSQDPAMSDFEKNAYNRLLNIYAPATTENIELPSFMSADFDASQYSPEVYPEAPAEEEMQVPINVPGVNIVRSRVDGSNIVVTTLDADGNEQTFSVDLDTAKEKNYITEGIYNQYKGQ